MKVFDELHAVVHAKTTKDAANNSGYTGAKYLEGVRDELEEVWAEMRDDNAVYLEDELGDILWDYLSALERLSHEGKIRSTEHVIAHAAQKYAERLPAGGVPSEEAWDAVKKTQKERLKKEHEGYIKDL